MPLRRLDRLDHLPVFELTRVTTLIDPYAEVPVGRHHDENGDQIADQDRPAQTAGQQDHTDPWIYAGPPADAPANPGDDDGVA